MYSARRAKLVIAQRSFSSFYFQCSEGGGVGRALPRARKQPPRIPELLFIKAGDLCTSPLASPRRDAAGLCQSSGDARACFRCSEGSSSPCQRTVRLIGALPRGRASWCDGSCPPSSPLLSSPPCRVLGLTGVGVSNSPCERLWEVPDGEGAFKLRNKLGTGLGGRGPPRRGQRSPVLSQQPCRWKANTQPDVYTPA